MSDLPTIVGWAIAGYLVGSISFARIVAGRVRSDQPVGVDALAFGADGTEVAIRGVSATSVSVRAGRRWGFLVVLLDAGKAAAVTLAARQVAPASDADLVAATFVVAGHVWPAWHRLQGGFGVSPMLGALLVIDPVAIPATILAGMLIGIVIADRLVVYDGWTLLLPAWFLAVRADPAAAVATGVMTAIYWWAMRVEVGDHLRRLRSGRRSWRERFADVRTGYTGDRRVG